MIVFQDLELLSISQLTQNLGQIKNAVSLSIQGIQRFKVWTKLILWTCLIVLNIDNKKPHHLSAQVMGLFSTESKYKTVDPNCDRVHPQWCGSTVGNVRD